MAKSETKSESSYNDRALTEGSADALPKPQIEIIVDGNSVFKPSMKTYFVDEYDEDEGKYTGVVMGEYCSCDTVLSTHVVCTCDTVCTCETVDVGVTDCSCDAVCTCESVGTPTETVCTCDPVCTCQDVCSCDGYCSCESYSSGVGGYVSCGNPCACVPVH